MKKNRIAQVLTGALALFALSAHAGEVHNWKSSNGEPVKNASGECWRDSNWTPATAAPGCDGALVEPVVVAPAVEAPVVSKAVEVELAPVVIKKFRISSDTFFDFDKAVLKADGKSQLDDLASKLKNINLEVVMAVGHTDSKGTDAYNLALSKKRAEAVKAYLVSKGVDTKLVTVDGKGEFEPVASNATALGRSKNRRVEIEAVGVLKNQPPEAR